MGFIEVGQRERAAEHRQAIRRDRPLPTRTLATVPSRMPGSLTVTSLTFSRARAEFHER
jgi:hypothetical protein